MKIEYTVDQLDRMCKDALMAPTDEMRSSMISRMSEQINLMSATSRAVGSTLDVSRIFGKIAVDLDDTVGTFEDDMRLALARRDGMGFEEALRRYPANPAHGIASWWEHEDDDPDRSYKEFLDLEKRGLLYENQPVRRGARETLNWLHKVSGGRVEFLTARTEKYNDVSVKWLKNNVGLNFSPVVKNSMEKEKISDYEVIVEDSVPNIQKIVAEDAPFGPRHVVFMTRPRSDAKIADSPFVHRAWDWSDVDKIFGRR